MSQKIREINNMNGYEYHSNLKCFLHDIKSNFHFNIFGKECCCDQTSGVQRRAYAGY